jgi:hypothetical protein
MAPPAFLASSFGYLSLLAVTDMATVVTSFAAMVLAQTPVWTSLGGGVYQSPVDGAGRFFTVTISSPVASRLRVIIKNESSLVISDRTVELDGGGNTVTIHAGQFHLEIESARVGTSEVIGGGLLDLSPRPQNSHSNYVYGHGYRDSAGTADGSGSSSDHFALIDAGVPGITQRLLHQTAPSFGAAPMFEASGFSEHTAAKMVALVGANVRRMGRMYHHWMVPDVFSVGAEVPIPIDIGVSGVFKVLGRAASGFFKLAVRKS